LKSEIELRAKFEYIRYAQVWEDADLLIRALSINENDVVLSIASAGDNAFSLLAQNPKKVYTIDLSFAQIACCELRRAMYRELSYEDHLLFGGVVRDHMDRLSVFKRLNLPADIREFWNENLDIIEKGFMTQGKFERYFNLFRKFILPFIHTKRNIQDLISPKSDSERKSFYDNVWNNFRWRMIFRLFFSRFVMGRLGRDKEFFKFVDGSVSDKILTRAKHALSVMDTSDNPYLHFILQGQYKSIFPFSLRRENYNIIRDNLDKIEFRKISIEQFIEEYDGKINAFNLSDIFEYMTQVGMDDLYESMLSKAAPDARFAYWNMLAPRKCSNCLQSKFNVHTDEDLNASLLFDDKAFFYSKFYLDIRH